MGVSSHLSHPQLSSLFVISCLLPFSISQGQLISSSSSSFSATPLKPNPLPISHAHLSQIYSSHFHFHPSMQLLLLPLLLHSFLLVTSLTYNPPIHFFINSGSHLNLTLDRRNFLADLDSTDAAADPNPSPAVPSLYHSARIFRRHSAYDFPIQRYGIFCLRLHFYAFNSPQSNLADAQFDVSTSNFSLLSKFSVPISNAPVIEEFFLTINHSKYSVEFTPTGKNSFGFVNAVELFLLPEDFVGDEIIFTATHNSVVRPQVLHTIHRVNIGGQQTQDPLWRNWVTDDEFFISKALAKECVPFSGEIGYGTLGGDIYSASDLVYTTCRELNLGNSSESVFPTITWVFEVNKNSRNFVRLHFCNIVSKTPDMPRFNLNIDNFTQLIDTSGVNISYSHFAAPFYFDFVVDSNELGSLNISVGSIHDSQVNNAYLNGLEIMEFSKNLDLEPNEEHSNRFVLIVVIVFAVGGLIFLILSGLAVFWVMKRRRKGKQRTTQKSSHRPSSVGSRFSYMSPVPNLNLNLQISLREISDATNGFSPKFLIGEGGFGKVYKGTLKDGRRVAVKRSDPQHGQGIPEFETEILVLSKIRHRHLVSLIGYCDESPEMILVYEFMENGTLKDHLYGSNPNLSWTQRLEICIGAARGLQYLHSGVDGGIIHRDVKSTNILLDENLVAKVADFGLSTSGPPDPDHLSVGIKGSFGYLDPEYFKTFEFTVKSDVYSFGVVLLEVLCGRAAIVSSAAEEEVSLAEWGVRWLRKGEVEKIMDSALVGKIKAGSVRKFGGAVEKCLSKNGEERPMMQEVVWELEYALQLQKSGVNSDEDSITQFSSINIRRLPSFGSSVLMKKDENDAAAGDGEGETAVFSQLADMDEAR